MSFRTKPCQNQCCVIHYRSYSGSLDFRHKYNRPKAGVFLHDDAHHRILVVQSRGMKWGPPKGTVELTDSTLEECALRELYEETGIRLSESLLTRPIQINRATYYDVSVDHSDEISVRDCDISGYTWIRTSCIRELDLNSHCKQLLKSLN